MFQLASSDDNPLSDQLPEVTAEVTENALSNLDKIESALPEVRGLEAADSEMDELAAMATASYKDLVDLGMQVESKNEELDNTPLGEGQSLDRNELLKLLISKNKDQ